jgi:hypothetical protein
MEQMSMLEEVAMAAGVEELVRKRSRKTFLGLDRRLWLLALLGFGVGIAAVGNMYTDIKAKGRQHSDKYPELAA